MEGECEREAFGVAFGADRLEDGGLQLAVVEGDRILNYIVWRGPCRGLVGRVIGVCAVPFAEARLVAFLEVVLLDGDCSTSCKMACLCRLL